MDTTWKSIEDVLQEGMRTSIPSLGMIKAETKGERLYDAIIAGDSKYVERFKATYKDENTYLSAVRKALRENDPRLKEAAIAKLNGDEDTYWDLFLDVVEEGKFEWELIEAAFKAEYNAQKNKADEEEK